MKNLHKMVVGKCERRYHLGGQDVEGVPRLKWIVKEISCENTDWPNVAQDSVH
jgi:hypothetical protein